MNHYKLSAAKKQAGMTLIELTVVLMILVGLAGLLIPYVAGFVGRTHDSSGADSIQEVAKAIAGYDAKYSGYPDFMDRLVDDAGTAPVPYLMNVAVATAAAPSALNLQSLFRGGILNLAGNCNDAADAACANFNPTFNYYKTANDREILMNGNIGPGPLPGTAPGATDGLLFVSADAVAQAADATTSNVEEVCGITNAAADDNADGTDDFVYIMLGVGPESDMTGRTIQSAPVHFAQVGAMNANNRYNRFIAIFKVDNDPAVGATNGADNATLLCTGMAMMTLEGPQQALQRYYDRQDTKG